jgi:hypothetical protein
MISLFCSILIGVILGLKFKILSILPLTFIGGCTIGAAALLMDQGRVEVLADLAIWAVALQVGFLIGSSSRFISFQISSERRSRLSASSPR